MKCSYIIGVLLIILIAGCNSSDLDKNGIPKVLKVGLSTSDEDAQETFRRLEHLRLYLEKKLQVPVKFYKVNGYAPVIEALRSKKVDIATMTPFAYLIARKKTNVMALFALGTKSGYLRNYRSCIITLRSSGIKSLADLKAKASHLTIVFTNPTSTSGYVIPRTYLTKNGLIPDKDFRKMMFTDNSLATLLSVVSGKADVAGEEMLTIGRLKAIKKDFEPDSVFNFIWVSDPLPPHPWCIRKDINPLFRQKILEAYQTIKTEDTAAWSCAMGSRLKYYTTIPIDSFQFISAREEWYNGLEEMVKNINGLELPK